MNGYALSFDMEIERLEQFYGTPYNNAYADIRKVLMSKGFEWIQGSTYVTKGNLVNLNEAIIDLKAIDWFCKSVRDIMAFKIEEWSDFTPSFKKTK